MNQDFVDMARRVNPQVVAEQLVSVQPMPTWVFENALAALKAWEQEDMLKAAQQRLVSNDIHG